jgi:hypothetical protein
VWQGWCAELPSKCYQSRLPTIKTGGREDRRMTEEMVKAAAMVGSLAILLFYYVLLAA